MNQFEKRRLAGTLYIIAGILLVAWASSLVFQLLICILGLILINNGLQLRGNRTLWSYGASYFFKNSRFF